MADFLKPGTQAMVARGIKPDYSGFFTEPKRCGCCGTPSVVIDVDNAKSMVMSCDECLAVEVITKGSPAWWYHGARPASDWPARFLERAYGYQTDA